MPDFLTLIGYAAVALVVGIGLFAMAEGTKTSVELGNVDCEVEGFNYREVAHHLSTLPGVHFPKQPPSLWTGCGSYTTFTFGTSHFKIEGHPWYAALLIVSTDEPVNRLDLEAITAHMKLLLPP